MIRLRRVLQNVSHLSVYSCRSYLAHSKIGKCGVTWSSWILLVATWQSAVYWGLHPILTPHVTLMIVSNIHGAAFFKKLTGS